MQTAQTSTHNSLQLVPASLLARQHQTRWSAGLMEFGWSLDGVVHPKCHFQERTTLLRKPMEKTCWRRPHVAVPCAVHAVTTRGPDFSFVGPGCSCTGRPHFVFQDFVWRWFYRGEIHCFCRGDCASDSSFINFLIYTKGLQS